MRKHQWEDVGIGVEWCRLCGAVRHWHAGFSRWQRTREPKGVKCTPALYYLRKKERK